MGNRNQSLTIIYAVMACLLFLLVVQFVMLMVSIDAFLGGHSRIVVPAAVGSGACFAGACWLMRFMAAARPRSLT